MNTGIYLFKTNRHTLTTSESNKLAEKVTETSRKFAYAHSFQAMCKQILDVELGSLYAAHEIRGSCGSRKAVVYGTNLL